MFALRNPRSDHGAATALRSIDVRLLATTSALGRLAIGVGLALAPRPALGALGFDEPSPSTITVGRIAGGRDIVLGALTLVALADPERLRTASFANAAVDAGDALTFAAALRAGAGQRTAATRGVAAALPATAAGLWVALRLRRAAARS